MHLKPRRGTYEVTRSFGSRMFGILSPNHHRGRVLRTRELLNPFWSMAIYVYAEDESYANGNASIYRYRLQLEVKATYVTVSY